MVAAIARATGQGIIEGNGEPPLPEPQIDIEELIAFCERHAPRPQTMS
jgi:hypothetical protein